MELTQTEAYIKQEEGYRRHMYKCPSGKWTIGIGLNLEADLPEDEAETILRLRLDKLKAQLGAELPSSARPCSPESRTAFISL